MPGHTIVSQAKTDRDAQTSPSPERVLLDLCNNLQAHLHCIHLQNRLVQPFPQEVQQSRDGISYCQESYVVLQTFWLRVFQRFEVIVRYYFEQRNGLK